MQVLVSELRGCMALSVSLTKKNGGKGVHRDAHLFKHPIGSHPDEKYFEILANRVQRD